MGPGRSDGKGIRVNSPRAILKIVNLRVIARNSEGRLRIPIDIHRGRSGAIRTGGRKIHDADRGELLDLIVHRWGFAAADRQNAHNKRGGDS